MYLFFKAELLLYFSLNFTHFLSDKVFAEAKKASKPVVIISEDAPMPTIAPNLSLLRLFPYWDTVNKRFTNKICLDRFLLVVGNDLRKKGKWTRDINYILDTDLESPFHEISNVNSNRFYKRMLRYFWDKKRAGYNFWIFPEMSGLDTYFKFFDVQTDEASEVVAMIKAKKLGPRAIIMEYRGRIGERTTSFRDKDTVKQINRLLNIFPDMVVVVIRGAAHRKFLLDKLRNKGYKPSSFISPSARVTVRIPLKGHADLMPHK